MSAATGAALAFSFAESRFGTSVVVGDFFSRLDEALGENSDPGNIVFYTDGIQFRIRRARVVCESRCISKFTSVFRRSLLDQENV